MSMSHWLREAAAGGLAALVTLAALLSLGLLAFSPLGAQAVRVATASAFTASAVSALIYSIFGRTRLPTGGPGSATALMVAGLAATLVLDPAVQAQPVLRLGWVLAGVAAGVAGMGIMQLLISACGLVQLVNKVPKPVLAGFSSAIAVLMVLGQFSPLLGFSWHTLLTQGTKALAAFKPGALLLGLGTAALAMVIAKQRPQWPAALLVLVLGTLVFHGIAVFVPAADLGPELGDIPHELPMLQGWAVVRDTACHEFLQRHAWTILGTAAAMAVSSALESVMVVLAFDETYGERTDLKRELLCLGLANVVGGLCGAMPINVLRSRAVALLQAGGKGWRAAAAICVTSGLLFLVGAPLLAGLPLAVLGGVMLVIAWALVDIWTRSRLKQLLVGPRPPELGWSLALVACVTVSTVWQGPLFGIGLGIVLAAVLFTRQLSRSLVRGQYSAAQRPSRRVYPLAAETELHRLRPAITVLELEGSLFFGNAEQLKAVADGLPANCRYLVLDLRRVGSVDDTGAHALDQLAVQLKRQGARLLLAHAQSRQPLGRRLQMLGVARLAGTDSHADADQAIEAAETALLARETGAAPAPAQDDTDNALFLGLDAAETALVRAQLQPVTLAAGQPVFRQGDKADAIYLVAAGSVSIFAPAVGGGPGTRYASVSPGNLFGEAAVLAGGGRSADALADTETLLLRLDVSTLSALHAAHPALGAQLYLNLARYLALRLRIASIAWTAAAA